MKKRFVLAAVVFVFLGALPNLQAQVGGKNFGLGIQVGDPTGLTFKWWSGGNTAWAFQLGNSYFGGFRIGADHLWHFNAFNSNIVKMHAGVGGVLGLGDGHRGGWVFRGNNKWRWGGDDDFGIGARGLIGIDIFPRNTPLEIFLDAGILVGIIPVGGAAFEAALGIRFYP